MLLQSQILSRFFHPSFPNPGFDTFPEIPFSTYLTWENNFYKNSDGRCDVTCYANSANMFAMTWGDQ